MAEMTSKGRRSAEELKAAALRVIARQGYLATKITDITTEAGKSAGVFYRYFTDKDDLLREVAEDFAAALHDRVSHELGERHEMRDERDVERHVRAYWDIYRAFQGQMTGLYQASLMSAEFSVHWEQMHERHVTAWSSHLSEARRLEPADGECALAARALVCMLEHYCRTTVPSLSDEDDGEVHVRTLTRLAAHGILHTGQRPER
ncbi:TetR/AcrR family transcriptional regulator [Streptomyces sp. NPDC057617]|uniref:TetR/AcrR family transcriptional regulator n=1 Tax=Streptomyces sp. NPDC057617 TaxID=3346184 RepID=UPI00368C2DA2